MIKNKKKIIIFCIFLSLLIVIAKVFINPPKKTIKYYTYNASYLNYNNSNYNSKVKEHIYIGLNDCYTINILLDPLVVYDNLVIELLNLDGKVITHNTYEVYQNTYLPIEFDKYIASGEYYLEITDLDGDAIILPTFESKSDNFVVDDEQSTLLLAFVGLEKNYTILVYICLLYIFIFLSYKLLFNSKDKKIMSFIFLISYFFCCLIFIRLLLKPEQTIRDEALYNTKEISKNYSFSNVIKQKITINIDNFNTIYLYLNPNVVYDNFIVELSDLDGKIITHNSYEVYQNIYLPVSFDKDILSGTYILTITDLDGDNFELPMLSSYKNNYIINELNKKQMSLVLIALGKKDFYFLLWYPIMAIVILSTLYPFVERKIKNEK